MNTLRFAVPLILCLLAAALVTAGCTAPPAGSPAKDTPMNNTACVTATRVPDVPPVSPTVSPEPAARFPDARAPGEMVAFGSADVASEATVYRSWLNDTYQWHNTMDNNYYTQYPKKGSRYLIVFISIVNRGNTRVWPPSPAAIHLWYDGKEWPLDPDHVLPDQTKGINDMTIRIGEIQYYHQLYSSELVTDYGYSHGKKLNFLYPGESNALDGYLIYVVPASLAINQTYVQIVFNGNDTGVWKLSGS
jgi:hypothetical protein